MVEQVHHVAVAVEDLDAAVETYERLFGATLELRASVPSQGVEAAYLRLGESRIELVVPLEADTPVGRFLARRGPGVHHVAVEVDDLPAAIRRLEQAGANVVDSEPSRGLGDRFVSFVHPESTHGVLVEMIAHA